MDYNVEQGKTLWKFSILPVDWDTNCSHNAYTEYCTQSSTGIFQPFRFADERVVQCTSKLSLSSTSQWFHSTFQNTEPTMSRTRFSYLEQNVVLSVQGNFCFTHSSVHNRTKCAKRDRAHIFKNHQTFVTWVDMVSYSR